MYEKYHTGWPTSSVRHPHVTRRYQFLLAQVMHNLAPLYMGRIRRKKPRADYSNLCMAKFATVFKLMFTASVEKPERGMLSGAANQFQQRLIETRQLVQGVVMHRSHPHHPAALFQPQALGDG